MKLYSLFFLAVLGMTVSSHPFGCFPRMVNQQNLRPFERAMPDMPDGTVPFQADQEAPAADQVNPVPLNEHSLSLGRIYYGYYCVMCHGEDGKGDSLAGRSFVPRPSDLTDPQYTIMPDSELARRMIAGKGHEPVLDTTVPLERRWYIIRYMRTIAN